MSDLVPLSEKWRNPQDILPKDWCCNPLLSVTMKIADRDHTTPKYISKDEGVPIVSPTNLCEDMRLDLRKLKYISEEAHKKNKKKTDLQPSDIIFSRIGAGLGKSYLLTKNFYDFSILHSLCQIRVNEVLSPEYLLWFLRSDYLQWRLKFGIQSIGVPDLGLGEIGELPIFYPQSKEEQKKIATILTAVDNSIEKTQAQIDKLKDLKTGMMQTLLTKGIGHTEFKDSPVGRIPVGWKVVKICDLADVKGGKRLPKGSPFSEEKTPYPYIRISDFSDGSISTENIKFVRPEDREKIKRYTISKNDIYVSIAGIYLGLFGEVPNTLDGALLTENAAKLIFKNLSHLNKTYFRYMCQSNLVQSQLLQEKGIGAGVPKLALFRISETFIVLPPKSEQDSIAKILSELDFSIFKKGAKLRSNERIKKALMQDLLTGKVRVKIDG
ncbi:MAG: restriction endonuclease subunit S [Methylococcales bacterium]|jgi:type I restriction enzyme, S subunit|nr:restriction endonuclease subunit S [Methylococcales bacterium]